MKIVSKLAFVILALLLLPSAIAASTTINVKTLPDHDVHVSIMDISQTQYLHILSTKSDNKGKASVNFDDDTISTFKLALKVKLNDQVVLELKKFDKKYSTGSTVDVEYFPEDYIDPFIEECDSEHFGLCLDEQNCTDAEGFWYDNVCNSEEQQVEETPEETTLEATTVNETSETADENTDITGQVINKDNSSKSIPSFVFWIIGAALIIAAAVFFIIKKGPPRMRFSKKLTYRSQRAIEHELYVAEKKLKSAQTEIKKLENKEKIDEVKKRIENEKKELNKLEKGEN